MLESILLGASPQQLRAHRAAHREQGWAACAGGFWPPRVWVQASSSLATPALCSPAVRADQVPSKTTSPDLTSSAVIPLCSDSPLHILRQLYNQCSMCWTIRRFLLGPDLKYWYSHIQNDVVVPALIQEAPNCSLVLIFMHFFSFFFPAESQGQTKLIFKDYLPGSSDTPQQNTPVEPTRLWNQASHTHNLPPGLEYLNQVLNLSDC